MKACFCIGFCAYLGLFPNLVFSLYLVGFWELLHFRHVGTPSVSSKEQVDYFPIHWHNDETFELLLVVVRAIINAMNVDFVLLMNYWFLAWGDMDTLSDCLPPPYVLVVVRDEQQQLRKAREHTGERHE